MRGYQPEAHQGTPPGPKALTYGVVVGIALALALVGLSRSVQSGPVAFDEPLSAALRTVAAGPLGLLFRLVSLLGSLPVWSTVVVIAAVALWVLRRRLIALTMLLGLTGELVGLLVKLGVNRPRPQVPSEITDLVATGSFPSSHVVRVTVALTILVALLVWPNRRWRWPLVLAAATFLVLMGVARIASGEHWPTDVIGGYLLGAFWADFLMIGLVAGWSSGVPREQGRENP